MSEEISTETRHVPPEVEVPDIGLGTMRTSGTYIVLLLQLESEPFRASILVEAAKSLGISLDELTGQYLDKSCKECGVSEYSHRANGGQCF